MFDTSKDILNIVLAVSALGLTVFICWSLWYLIATLKSVYKAIKEIMAAVEKVGELVNLIESKIEAGSRAVENFGGKIDDIFNTVKEKVTHTGSYLMVIGEVLRRIFDFLQQREDRWAPRRDEEVEMPRRKTSKKL